MANKENFVHETPFFGGLREFWTQATSKILLHIPVSSSISLTKEQSYSNKRQIRKSFHFVI